MVVTLLPGAPPSLASLPRPARVLLVRGDHSVLRDVACLWQTDGPRSLARCRRSGAWGREGGAGVDRDQNDQPFNQTATQPVNLPGARCM